MAKTLIETITVGAGGVAAIEFTSIPQNGTDLFLTLALRQNTTSNTPSVQFNNDTGSNYSAIRLNGTGTGVSSTTITPTQMITLSTSSSTTAGVFASASMYIPNYTSSVLKSISNDEVQENNNTASLQRLVAGSWNNISAISSIKIFLTSGLFDQHSTASLYKITAG